MLTTAVKKTLSGMRATIQTLQKIDAEIRLHHHKIKQFKPHVQFSFDRGHYVVKTAENGAELEECLKLRFEVFHREFLKKKRKIGVDIDKLDFQCDHLVIFDRRVNRVIGTYRLNCTRFTDTFYSAGEFEMGNVLKEPGYKLELGRACIDKDYRNGVVMTLLWRGIAEYIQLTESKYLFGCASIKTTDKFETALVYKLLKDRGYVQDYGIVPTRKFKIPDFDGVVASIESSAGKFNAEAVEEMIPPLFNSYLKAGAKICGEPALDLDFCCVDFLTLLKMDEINPLLARKFKI